MLNNNLNPPTSDENLLRATAALKDVQRALNRKDIVYLTLSKINRINGGFKVKFSEVDLPDDDGKKVNNYENHLNNGGFAFLSSYGGWNIFVELALKANLHFKPIFEEMENKEKLRIKKLAITKIKKVDRL